MRVFTHSLTQKSTPLSSTKFQDALINPLECHIGEISFISNLNVKKTFGGWSSPVSYVLPRPHVRLPRRLRYAVLGARQYHGRRSFQVDPAFTGIVNKMVNPYNGPEAKLLLPTTLVKMTITGHHMVIQSTSPKIDQALMSTLAQVTQVTQLTFAH